ncbi:transcriptional regulator, TetR family [Marinococcus luteus]|uniref:Transcriptional regulator, TetR family n=1 Tax=Marinococcus luteus TaxID=1122204 RepID=A0A1H2X3K1_9BACI|nr:TetR/AcrR family transcriptional regulator [Marinococcus luteus]SDW87493.1 transcriptional regulator, TetR family [Marinococcus luteus]
MDEKKIYIQQTAMQLFSSQGFFHTSVQDIAEACRMSKASIYKIFHSKEDILAQIVRDNLNHIIHRANYARNEQSKQPRDQLIAKLSREIEGLVEHREYVWMLYQSASINKQSDNIKALLKQGQLIMVNWHKDTLLETFGADIEPFVWDLAICMQGMSREMIAFAEKVDRYNFDFEQLAEVLVTSIESIIKHKTSSASVFSSEDMEPFNLQGHYGEIDQKDLWDRTIQQVRAFIHYRFPSYEKKQWVEAVDRLNQEFYESEPEMIVMESLFCFLEKNEDLQININILREIFQ